MISISKRYSFDAAHQLRSEEMNEALNVETFGKCAQLHGHTYTLEVEVTGNVNYFTGMVLNYFDLDEIVKPIVEELDHKFLNEVFGFLTTAENMVESLAGWIKSELDQAGTFITLKSVTLQETPKTKAVWHGTID